MGLERMAAIMQGVDTMFEVDTIRHILEYIAETTGKKYGRDPKSDVSIRVITDHIRGVTNMISDGVLPSNEGRGYVLRRLLRRAARHGKLLGLNKSFLYDVSTKVIEVSGKAYPVLEEKKDYIQRIIRLEEERFQETLDQGISILQGYASEIKDAGTGVLPGDKAFKLYDTYGFPLDLTRDILEEEGIAVDENGFETEMAAQRERARAARAEAQTVGWSDEVFSQLEGIAVTRFEGYEKNSLETEITAVLKENVLVKQAVEGDRVAVVLDATPFYAESGGQIGDTGKIKNNAFVMEVEDCKALQGRFLHIGPVKTGTIKPGMKVSAVINKDRRSDIARNHTATHLLHRTLRKVLGNHVEQAGSLVEPDRLRFDFTHTSAVTAKQLEQIEAIVNKRILDGLQVETLQTDLESAREMGATALFDEKYGELVRVVKAGDFSIELCGGTHVDTTSSIGFFVLAGESGIAAGVRRLEAFTGRKALEYLKDRENILKEAALLLKASPENLTDRIKSVMEELKSKDREMDSLRRKLAVGETERLLNRAKDIKGVKLITARVDDLDMSGLRSLGDSLRDKLESGVVVLASVNGGKINMVAMASKDAVSAGAHSGRIIKEAAAVAGGGGGGKPDMAQAGARKPEKIMEALDKAYEILQSQLK
jgi:alanyl-tRNA synthetase